MGKRMGKKNQKQLRRQNDEKEFEEMKSRIMKDIRSENRVRKPAEKPEKDYEKKEENTPPVSHTSDFMEMMSNLVSEVAVEGVSIECVENRKKEDSGIVLMDVTFKSTNDEKYNRVFFYYIEERGLKHARSFPAVITIINQKNGNVLFNKFGTNAIEKARNYIVDILKKNASSLLK